MSAASENNAKFPIMVSCKVTPVCSPRARRPRLFSLSSGEWRVGGGKERATDRGTELQKSVGCGPAHLGCSSQTSQHQRSQEKLTPSLYNVWRFADRKWVFGGNAIELFGILNQSKGPHEKHGYQSTEILMCPCVARVFMAPCQSKVQQ